MQIDRSWSERVMSTISHRRRRNWNIRNRFGDGGGDCDNMAIKVRINIRFAEKSIYYHSDTGSLVDIDIARMRDAPAVEIRSAGKKLVRTFD